MNKRQTGRTTRMLEAALSEASDGNYVFIVTAHEQHRKQLQQSVADSVGGTIAGPKVYCDKWKPGGQISFENRHMPTWDWRNLRFTGMYPTCKVFIDHFTIEEEYGRILLEWERWDKK